MKNKPIPGQPQGGSMVLALTFEREVDRIACLFKQPHIAQHWIRQRLLSLQEKPNYQHELLTVNRIVEQHLHDMQLLDDDLLRNIIGAGRSLNYFEIWRAMRCNQ